MNDHEADRIAAAMNQLRPDWPTSSVRTLIRKHLMERPRRDVAVALAWIACEANTSTPARVIEQGPWWRAVAVEGSGPTRNTLTLSWADGDPRQTCGICDMRREDCEYRAATNGHEFVARTKCLPPSDPPTWMDRRTTKRACGQGLPDDGCQLEPAHDGQHQPASMTPPNPEPLVRPEDRLREPEEA